MQTTGFTRMELQAVALSKYKRKAADPTQVKPLSRDQVQSVMDMLRMGKTYQECADSVGTTRCAIAGYAFRLGYSKAAERDAHLGLRSFSWEA